MARSGRKFRTSRACGTTGSKEQPLEVQYAPVHEVELVRGGILHGLAGAERVMVNSLHSQGVQTLGGDLEIEARAADGLIEAFRVRNAPGSRSQCSGARNGRS